MIVERIRFRLGSGSDFWVKFGCLRSVDPWEHVVGMGLGAVFANQLVKWDVKLKEDLDVMLNKARAANERRYFGISSFSSFSFLNFDLFWFESVLLRVCLFVLWSF